ncbi:hypothetical protein JHK82_048008 [Glycine max]|nr:hypothetical protein JHK82_048008 [Glycine max]
MAKSPQEQVQMLRLAQTCRVSSASSQQKQLLRHRSPNPIPFPSLLHSVCIRMHSTTHAEAERLLGTHSHIRDLGLDSSLELHAVSDDMKLPRILSALKPCFRAFIRDRSFYYRVYRWWRL